MAKKDEDKIKKNRKELEEKKKKVKEEEIDEQLKQTFPASDPPSYSIPSTDKDD